LTPDEEQALRQEIHLDRSLHVLSMSKDGFVVLMDDKIIFTNEAFREMFGPEGSQLYNINFDELIVPELFADYSEKKRACLTEHKYGGGFPTQIRYKNGRIIHVDVGFSEVFMGTEKASLVVVRDKTEQKELQEAVETSESRFLQLYMTSPIAFFSLTKRGIIQQVNPAAENLLGYKAADLLKRNITSLFFSSSSSSSTSTQLISEVLQGKQIRDVEMQFKNANGEAIWLSVTASLLESKKNPLISLMAIDIDRRKGAESRAKAERDRANLYLEVMTHDLTNVHQSLLFSVGLLETMVELPEPAQRLLTENHWNLRRAARMISNLRSLMTVGEEVIPTEPTDFSLHLDSAMDQVRNDFPTMDIEINVTKPDEYIQIVGETQLHKILFTIIHNSVMHNESEKRVVDIDISQDSSGQKYRVVFSDNGLGVPDSLKEFIFKRTGAPDSQIVGRGLGLTLVDSMVAKLGGTIWVEDRVPGDTTQGAKFVLELPAWKAEIILECGRNSCITFYKSDHCLFCNPTLEIIIDVLGELGLPASMIEIINVDDPGSKISAEEIPVLPLTKICGNEISGFADIDHVRMALMELLMKSCYPY